MNTTLIYNFSLYIVLFLFTILFFKRNHVAWFVAGFYALGSLCAFFVPMYNHYYVADIFITSNYSKVALLYLFLTFCLFFTPLLQSGINYSAPILHIPSSKNGVLFFCSRVYFCILFISILVASYCLLKNGVSFNTFFTSKEDAIASIASYGSGISTLFKFSETFSDVFLVYAFYLLFNHPVTKYAFSLIVGILFFSLLYALLTMSRNSMLHTIFSLFLLMMLFRMYSNTKIYDFFKGIAIFFIAIILGAMLFVSIQRFFSDRGDVEYTQFIMLRYAGEPMLNFGSWIDRIQDNTLGVKNFSSILSMLHLEPSRDFSEIRNFCYKTTQIPSYIFFSFIGSFVCDFGFLITFFIGLFSAFLFSKRNNALPYKTSFTRISFFYFYSLFLLDGYFFFSYASRNVKLLVTVFFLIFLKFSLSNQEENE